jgi:hypothetical protein
MPGEALAGIVACPLCSHSTIYCVECLRRAPEPARGAGRTCTLRWRALRKWSASRVVYEHRYDQEQIGGPMTLDDLRLSAATVAAGFRRPS